MLTACAARRWLAHHAAGVKLIHGNDVDASVCASLVSCLPALEGITLDLPMLISDDLVCLLEVLAWCPGMRALDLSVECFEVGESVHLPWPFPCASAFAKLSSVTKLALDVMQEVPFTLADVLGALVPLKCLAELSLGLPQLAVVPAALGRFKGLQSLAFQNFSPSVLEVGCLDLPNLLSLDLKGCYFDMDAEELPGLTALQRLTRIEMSGDFGPRFFDSQLVQLPGLQRLVLAQDIQFF